MLTIEKLPEALIAKGFVAKGQRYSKTVGTATLQVLLGKQEIVYPETDGLVIMRNIKVPVPLLAEQKCPVAKVQGLEQKIADGQAVIPASPARKQAILPRHL